MRIQRTANRVVPREILCSGDADQSWPSAVKLLKSAARAIVLTPIRRLRKRARRARRHRDEQTLLRHAPLVVHSGPFKEMSLRGAISPLGPKVLGTHEMELGGIFDELCRLDIHHVVNVGGADGFYATGLLRHFPNARGTVFEMIDSHHAAIAEMAAANDVKQRLTILGACTVDTLSSVIRDAERTLVLMDVEGAERDLLDPARIPSLRKAFVLVELHDFVDPHISKMVRDRFTHTHRLTTVQSRPRRVEDLPAIEGVDAPTLLRLATEGRPTRMEWFWLRPDAPG
jgi:hypothetical protein